MGQHTGDGKFDGETFLGRTWMFFWEGQWRGSGTPGRVLLRRFHRTTQVPNSPVYVIYYMLSSGGFAAVCLQSIAKGVLDPRLPWADTCTVQVSTTRRPSPHIEDGEGAVDPRSVTDSTEQWV